MENKRIDRIEERLDLIESEIHKLKESKIQEKENLTNQRQESPREFLLKHDVKSDVEKTLIAISYLENKDAGEISSVDVKNTLIKMREKVKFNVPDKIQQLANRGLLDDIGSSGKKKFWQITNKGLKFLEGLKEDGRE